MHEKPIYADGYFSRRAARSPKTALGLGGSLATPEVALGDAAHLSLADGSKASIAPGHGAGITLSWAVLDLTAAHAWLHDKKVPVTNTARRLGSDYIELHDPEGIRIELWKSTT